jgi:NAD(P)-dependent dehydrogenase (short-subunit alcohol dehydrogenase family)
MADLYALKDNVLKFAPAIDILFANAGYGKFAPIEDVTEAMFDELYGILVKGTYFTIQQLLPIMNPGGSIILNTSIVTAYGSQYASIYSSSKAAVQSLVKTLAAEFAVRKIRVNAVSPGHTETDIYSKTGIPADQIPGIKKAITATLPLQRYAEAAEVAKAVTFLASDDASYLHGTEITVDGGYTMIR